MADQSDPPALDVERHLPPGQMWFSVRQVARHLGITGQHVADLITEGRFTYQDIGPIDLAGKPGKTRSTTRIPRACLVAFLQASARDRSPYFVLIPRAYLPPVY